MENVHNLFKERDLEMQRIGARLILAKLLEEVRPDWNGYGMRIRLTQELEGLEDGV